MKNTQAPTVFLQCPLVSVALPPAVPWVWFSTPGSPWAQPGEGEFISAKNGPFYLCDLGVRSSMSTTSLRGSSTPMVLSLLLFLLFFSSPLCLLSFFFFSFFYYIM